MPHDDVPDGRNRRAEVIFQLVLAALAVLWVAFPPNASLPDTRTSELAAKHLP